MLRIKNINLTKKQTNILNNISLECSAGTINIFIGKSGAGKTSLLKCIGQLDRTYLGKIEFNDQDLKNYSQKDKAELLGFVFQQYNLFPHMTIIENCTNPLIVVKKFNMQKSRDIAYDMLEKFGLTKFANLYPTNLSGGQQQRAAIARTLCFNPKVICLDEPSSALDPENTALLISLLKDIAKTGAIILLSSQDMPFVKAIADKIIMLEEGNLIETCNIQDLKQKSSKISTFMDMMN